MKLFFYFGYTNVNWSDTMKELMWTIIIGIILFGGFFFTVKKITEPIEKDFNTNQTKYILDESQIDEAEKSIHHYLDAIENDIKININQDIKYKPPRQCKIGKNPRFCKISYRENIAVGIIDHYPNEGKLIFDKHGNIIGGHIKIYRFSFQINPDRTLTRE